MGVLGVVDAAIVAASLAAVFGVGIFVMLTSRRNADVASEFFLAGRRSPWWLIAASLVASNIGTEHFVGQAGAAAYSGIVLSLYGTTQQWQITSGILCPARMAGLLPGAISGMVLCTSLP